MKFFAFNRSFIVLFCLLIFQAGAWAWSIPEPFQKNRYSDSGQNLDYYLLSPSKTPVGKIPAIIYLHSRENAQGQPPLDDVLKLFIDNRETFPAYVMVPVCPAGLDWNLLKTQGTFIVSEAYQTQGTAISSLTIKALDDLAKKNLNIDINRLYLTGSGTGGYGAWDMLVRYPNKWAAVAPCAGGTEVSRLAAVAKTPIWASASLRSSDISVNTSRQAIEALKVAGSQPLYSEYGLSGYMKFFKEPELLRWLFAQTLGKPAVSFKLAARPYAMPPANLCAGSGYLNDLPEFPERWLNYRQAWAATKDADQGAVVFIGDSITDVWANKYGTGDWTPLAQSFDGLKTKNLGIAGDLSRGVLERIQDVIALNPKAVNLLIGTNDFSFGDEFYSNPKDETVCRVIVGNIKLIIAELRRTQPNLPVIVNTVMPRGIPKILVLNALIKKDLSVIPRVYICDAYSVFVDGSTNQVKAGYTSDGVHPVKKGYDAWLEILRPLITKALTDRTARLDYPYAPYNQGKLSPQLTGWPLSPEEFKYSVSDKTADARRPGREPGGSHVPKMWPVTPFADGGGLTVGADWYYNSHRDLLNVVERYKKDHGSDIDVLLIGDSITWQWCGMNAYSSYPQPLNKAWTSRFGTTKTLNIGIGGDKTQGVLWRLDHGGDILGGLNPKVVVMAIGHNDMFFSRETGCDAAASGIDWCVKNVRSLYPNAEVIVSKIFPNTTPTSNFYQDAIAINQELDKLKIDSDPKIHLMPDMWKEMTLADGSINLSYFNAQDKVHLTEAGYEAWGKKLKVMIDPLLAKALPKTTPSVGTLSLEKKSLGVVVKGYVYINSSTAPTERGICWSTYPNPTIHDTVKVIGKGFGEFQDTFLTPLPDTTYYFCAYAKNDLGTSYGTVHSHKTERLITQAPVITSEKALSSILGGIIEYQITATEKPSSFGGNHLPVGLTLNKTTGLLSGAIKTVGVYNVELTATNAVGTGTATLQITVSGAEPVIIFDDKVNIPWSPNGFNSTMKTSSEIVRNGSLSMAITLEGGAGGFLNTYGKFDTSPYDYLSFWIHGGNVGGQELRLAVELVSGQINNYNLPQLQANTWTKQVVKLADLGINNNSFYVLRFGNVRNSEGLTFYIDDFMLGSGQATYLPTVESLQVVNITGESATLQATILSNGGLPISVSGVCFSTNPLPDLYSRKSFTVTNSGNYSAIMPGLDPNTNYYARAFVTNPEGTAYGKELSFRTGDAGQPASVPFCTSLLNAQASTKTPFVYKVEALQYPKTFSSSNLPEGLLLDVNSGYITGTPMVAGNTSVKISISNSFGTTEVALNLKVVEKNSTRLYDEKIEYPWYQNGIAARMTPVSTVMAHSGKNSYEIIMASEYGNAGFLNTNGSFDTTPYDHFSFWIHGGVDGGQDLFVMASNGTTVNDGYVLPTLKANSWTKFTIPLKNLYSYKVKDLLVVRFHNRASKNWKPIYLDEVEFTSGAAPSLPAVFTRSSVDFEGAMATVKGEVSENGKAPIVARGFCWGTTPKPTLQNNKVEVGKGEGVFTAQLSNLLPNVVYYVRSYVVNEVGINYGNIITFTSQPVVPPKKPTVTTGSVKVQDDGSVILSGNSFNNGALPMLQRGFCWGLKTLPTLSDNNLVLGGGEGNFTSTLGNLKLGMTYYARAFATNTAGTAYGADQMFIPKVKIYPPVLAVMTQQSGVVGRGFELQLVAQNNPTRYEATNLPLGLSANVQTGKISGTPTSHGTWTATIKASNTAGSDTKSLSFSIGDVPKVAAISIMSVGTVSANCSSEVIHSGGTSGSLVRGVCWSTSPAPTLADSKSIDGQGVGAFKSSLQTLFASTTYYVRAYATNSLGTGYGPVLSFTTKALEIRPVIDSALEVSIPVGQTLEYYLTAKNRPTQFKVQNLPAGLSFDIQRAVIVGKMDKGGTYAIQLFASNGAGEAMATLNLKVLEQKVYRISEDGIRPEWYQNGWMSKLDPHHTQTVFQGTKSISMDLQKRGVGGFFHISGPFDMRPYDTVRFWIRSSQSIGTLTLKARLQSGDPAQGAVFQVSQQWQQIVASLNDLGVSGAKDLYAIHLRASNTWGEDRIFVDNFEFVSNGLAKAPVLSKTDMDSGEVQKASPIVEVGSETSSLGGGGCLLK